MYLVRKAESFTNVIELYCQILSYPLEIVMMLKNNFEFCSFIIKLGWMSQSWDGKEYGWCSNYTSLKLYSNTLSRGSAIGSR